MLITAEKAKEESEPQRSVGAGSGAALEEQTELGKSGRSLQGMSGQPVDDVGENSGGKKTASPSCFPKMRGCGGPRVEEDREVVRQRLDGWCLLGTGRKRWLPVTCMSMLV